MSDVVRRPFYRASFLDYIFQSKSIGTPLICSPVLTVISIAIQGLGCAATYICSQVSQIWFLLQTTHPFTYIYYDLYRSLWAAVKRLYFLIETLRVLLGQPTYIYYNLLWYFKNDLNRCLKYDLFPGLHHFSPYSLQQSFMLYVSISTNIWHFNIDE